MNTTTRSRLLEWRPLLKNTLRGFAKVQFPSGVIIAEVGIHIAGSRAWASPPSRPWVKDNAVVLDEAAKPRWQPLIEFATHGVRSSWSSQVLAAVREEYPEVFEGAEVAP
jgi:hypothetical protein